MKTSTKTVISINNISKVYEGPPPVRALDGVSLEIKEGDFVSIVGQSGSGKSTFLNMIGLLDSITDGSIEIEGKDVSELSDNELSKFRGEKIGFIFQSFFLLPGLTAQENVAEGLLYQGISRSEEIRKSKRSFGTSWSWRQIDPFTQRIVWWSTTKSCDCSCSSARSGIRTSR